MAGRSSSGPGKGLQWLTFEKDPDAVYFFPVEEGKENECDLMVRDFYQKWPTPEVGDPPKDPIPRLHSKKTQGQKIQSDSKIVQKR